jgi:hypothetical protein
MATCRHNPAENALIANMRDDPHIPSLNSLAAMRPPTGCAGHAGATASLKLTFQADHSVGADQGAVGKQSTLHC